jgi:HPr kinase/phosphorylase
MSGNLVHATAVAINGQGILLMGPSGAGKSDMALRLIDRGAILVSDDAVAVDTEGDMPVVKPAPNIKGKLEIRGIGVCSMDRLDSAPLRMIVELSAEVDRMPASTLTKEICGYMIPCIKLVPFEISAAIKLERALRSIIDAGLWPVAEQSNASREGNRI